MLLFAKDVVAAVVVAALLLLRQQGRGFFLLLLTGRHFLSHHKTSSLSVFPSPALASSGPCYSSLDESPTQCSVFLVEASLLLLLSIAPASSSSSSVPFWSLHETWPVFGTPLGVSRRKSRYTHTHVTATIRVSLSLSLCAHHKQS